MGMTTPTFSLSLAAVREITQPIPSSALYSLGSLMSHVQSKSRGPATVRFFQPGREERRIDLNLSKSVRSFVRPPSQPPHSDPRSPRSSATFCSPFYTSSSLFMPFFAATAAATPTSPLDQAISLTRKVNHQVTVLQVCTTF